MTHTQTLKLGPANLDRVHAALVRAGVAEPDRQYEQPFELLAHIETLTRTLASARLSLALEQGARDHLRQLARQAAAGSFASAACSACRLTDQVLQAAHQTFGEPRPQSPEVPVVDRRALVPSEAR